MPHSLSNLFRRAWLHLCGAWGHNLQLDILTERHLLASPDLPPQFGSVGSCTRCSYTWNDLRPDDRIVTARNLKMAEKYHPEMSKPNDPNRWA